MKKYVIKIEGMHCEHCAKKVEEELKEFQCRVNLKKKEALIQGDSIKEVDIQKRVNSLGYEFLEMKEKKGLFL